MQFIAKKGEILTKLLSDKDIGKGSRDAETGGRKNGELSTEEGKKLIKKIAKSGFVCNAMTCL